MIYTLTLNPCLDVVKLDNDKFIVPGGKGINVSIMLSRFHIDNIALGFVGGEIGETIESLLEIQGVQCDFIHIRNTSRTNTKEVGASVLEKNQLGPKIIKKEIDELFAKLDTIENGSTLIMSGSIPPGVNNNIYAKIMRRLKKKDIRFVVDARGEALRLAIKEKPFLIKPNAEELLELFEDKSDTNEEIVKKARSLVKMGARNVIVSLGEKGAILVDKEGDLYREKAIEGEVQNTVGCGDSLLAGFIMSIDKGKKVALRVGVAFGSASSFKEWLAEPIDIAIVLSSLE